jgi:purine-binding chemotaxis protein CheW
MSESPKSSQLVVFKLGDEEYALPVGEVQEIIRYSEPRSVASDADWIRGVISLRGKIIPVCDLASRLGLERPHGTPGKIVVVEAGRGIAGIIVDDVAEVLTVTDEDIETLRVASGEMEHSIAKIGERLIVLIASDSVFGTTELAQAV